MSPEKMPAEENYQGIVQEIGFKAGSDELCTVVFEDGRRIEFSTVNYVSAVKREKTQTFIRPGDNVVVTIEGKQYAETKFAVKKGEWVEVLELEGYRVMK